MSRLDNLLAMFGPEVSLTPEECLASLNRTRQNPDTRELEGLKRELTELYRSQRTDWIALLRCQEGFMPFEEVYEVTDQNVARAFVTRWIWNALFPAEADCPPSAS